MADTIPSSNMSMPIPVVGVDPGPQWGEDLNTCLTIVDNHDHSIGNGVPITPDGMSISSDLSFSGNNAIALRTARFSVQGSAPAEPTDKDCIYVTGVDLYYIDGSGNNVRITQSGAVAGTPGSIANLVSPASASYVAADETFVWQSDTSVAATLDARNVILRNSSASSKGLTLTPPAAMGSNYSLTLPSLPVSTKIMTLDTGGIIGASYAVDNSTIEVSSNIIQVKAGGIGTTQLADASVTQAKLATISASGTALAGQLAQSSSSGNYTSTSLSRVAITNLSVTITTLGRPVQLWCEGDGSGSNGKIGATSNSSPTTVSATFSFYRGSTLVTDNLFETRGWSAGHVAAVAPDTVMPPSVLRATDVVVAGTYTYTVQVISNASNTTAVCGFVRLYAKEM